MIRRRTRVWALAPKPESVDASFLFFPIWWGPKSWGPATKNQFCHVALMRCLVKFVVLQSHSQSICVLNQCHIKINTHLLCHIETFCLSPLFFTNTKFVSLLLLFSFNYNTLRNVFLKQRKSNWNTKAFLPQKKNLQSPINNKSKFVACL